MNKPDLGFYDTRRYKLTLCVWLSVFFFVFLIYFQPFGVNNNDPKLEIDLLFLFAMSVFACTTFLFSLINEFVLRTFFIKNPTQAVIVCWSCWTLLLLSVVNYHVYNILGGWHDYNFLSALEFIANCSSVLIFPIVGTFFYFKYQSLRQQVHIIQDDARRAFDPNQLIRFSGQGSNDQIMLSISSFQYARAQDNYVELFYLEGGSMAKSLVRISLSNLAESISHGAVARCHRSYLVNLFHVRSVKGGNDLRLYLSPFDTVIPVSKSYRDHIMNTLKTFS